MSNKLMLLPFALLLTPTSSKTANIATNYSLQPINKQDEEVLEELNNNYALLDFAQLAKTN